MRRDESLGEATDHRQVVEPERAQPLHSSRPINPSLGEAIDHRQVVKPERAQPLHNGNTQSTQALKGRRNTKLSDK